MPKTRAPWDALERFSLFLNLVLGSFFTLMLLAPNGDKERLLVVIVGSLGLLGLLSVGLLLLRQRRVAVFSHIAMALALLVLGGMSAWNLLTLQDRLARGPGLTLVTGLVGFAGLFIWLASRLAKIAPEV
jgi:CHASE2 domain-containing sensor protein